MRIRLLNDGGFGDMDNVKFPVEVEGHADTKGFDVKASELYRVGANKGTFGSCHEVFYFSIPQGECEVVDNG